MTRDELLVNIDKMVLREKDYKTLLFLVRNSSPKLFTKLLEEFFYGSLYISDFEPIFTESVSNIITENINIQDKIEKQYERMLALRISSETTGNQSEDDVIEHFKNKQQLIVPYDNPKSAD